MINAGCMQDPEVTAVFGAHVAPDLPHGTIGVRYGKFYAANNTFIMNIQGKGTHGAKPEKGIHALHAAADLVLRLQKLPEKFPDEKTVVSVCTFHSGTKENIISGEAQLSGTIRTLGCETKQTMQKYVEEAVRDIEKQYGVTIELRYLQAHQGIVNTDEMTAFALEALQEDFTVCELTEPTMVSEDFGFFVEASRGSFYHFGTGGEYELHSANFLPHESLLPLGAAAHACVAWSYLAKQC